MKRRRKGQRNEWQVNEGAAVAVVASADENEIK